MQPIAAHDSRGPSWQVPRSHSFLQLLQSGHIRGQCLAIGQLNRAVTALGVEKIQQAGGTALICIFADVARLLRLLAIPGSIELHHFVIAPHSLKGVGNIGKNCIAGGLLLLLRLPESVTGTRDFTLITVEYGQLKIHKERSRVLTGNVRKVVGSIYVYLGVRFSKEDLALCRRYPQFRGPEVGTLAQSFRLQVFQVGLERLIGQITNHVKIGRYRVIAQELPQSDKRLDLRQAGRGHVGLELQKLQLDLKIIAFADGASLELCLANIDSLLETLLILKREAKSGFRQQDADELLAHVEG